MSARQTLGLVLVFLLLFSGQILRTKLLVGPDGVWLSELETLPWATDPKTGSQASETAPAKLIVPLAINSAPVDSLILLPGVGPVLAGRIATARREGVVFGTMIDLQTVKGIGPRLAARLDTLLTYVSPLITASDSDSIPTFPVVSRQ